MSAAESVVSQSVTRAAVPSPLRAAADADELTELCLRLWHADQDFRRARETFTDAEYQARVRRPFWLWGRRAYRRQLQQVIVCAGVLATCESKIYELAGAVATRTSFSEALVLLALRFTDWRERNPPRVLVQRLNELKLLSQLIEVGRAVAAADRGTIAAGTVGGDAGAQHGPHQVLNALCWSLADSTAGVTHEAAQRFAWQEVISRLRVVCDSELLTVVFIQFHRQFVSDLVCKKRAVIPQNTLHFAQEQPAEQAPHASAVFVLARWSAGATPGSSYIRSPGAGRVACSDQGFSPRPNGPSQAHSELHDTTR